MCPQCTLEPRVVREYEQHAAQESHVTQSDPATHADGRLQSAFENMYVYEDVYMAVSTDDAVIDIGDV